MRNLIPLFIVTALLFTACTEEEVFIPRPKGYFRIALPEKKYSQWKGDCPFTMDIPEYSRVYKSSAPNAPDCWKDLHFGPFDATIYLSYNEITNDTLLASLINQSWELTEAHNEMSQSIRDSLIMRPEDKVYGTVITLGGNAASLVQFYLTDSVRNFVRGSLYFYSTPNKDSLQPVVDYIKKDVYRLVETLKWSQPGEVVVPAKEISPAENKQR
jgi:gliding motility-associated lipoprotein GldD